MMQYLVHEFGAEITDTDAHLEPESAVPIQSAVSYQEFRTAFEERRSNGSLRDSFYNAALQEHLEILLWILETTAEGEETRETILEWNSGKQELDLIRIGVRSPRFMESLLETRVWRRLEPSSELMRYLLTWPEGSRARSREEAEEEEEGGGDGEGKKKKQVIDFQLSPLTFSCRRTLTFLLAAGMDHRAIQTFLRILQEDPTRESEFEFRRLILWSREEIQSFFQLPPDDDGQRTTADSFLRDWEHIIGRHTPKTSEWYRFRYQFRRLWWIMKLWVVERFLS